jgi:hypothetical protein
MYNTSENEVVVHPIMKDRVNTRQAAKRMNVPDTTLVDWRKRNVGPRCFKIGGRWVYLLADLDAYIDQAIRQDKKKAQLTASVTSAPQTMETA